MIRRVGRVVVVAALLSWIYFLVSLMQVYQTGRTDEARSVDAIVVMGAAQYDGTPSAQLAARLDHVVVLWQQQIAPFIVVTGGKQPGDRFTEAEASARYLQDRGVPSSAILLENSGRTSFESFVGVADLLKVRALHTVVIVTDPYHSLRSRLIAQEVGLSAVVSPTPSSVIVGWTQFRRELREAAGVAAGRIIGFHRLSDITG